MSRAGDADDPPVAGFSAPPLLRLVPLQPEVPEPAEVRWLADELGARLGTRVQVAAAAVAEEGWMAPGGSQLSSGAIVDALIGRYPAGAPPSHPARAAGRRPDGSPVDDEERPGEEWVLALTAADLHGGGRRFVFGEAAQGGRWAVVGTARFGPCGDPRFRERLLKESLHELGHLAGLTHCDDPECLMARSADVAAVDRKGATLCPRCRGRAGESGT